jgi:hypothetical protein
MVSRAARDKQAAAAAAARWEHAPAKLAGLVPVEAAAAVEPADPRLESPIRVRRRMWTDRPFLQQTRVPA